MSEEEVRKTLDITTPPTAPNARFENYPAFKIPLQIDGDDYEVSLLFGRDSRKLEAVSIEGKGKIGLRFHKLRNLLTDKYGQPAEPKRERVEWRFKSTLIVLSNLDISGVVSSTFL